MPRYDNRPACVGERAALFQRLVTKPAREEPGHERIAGTQYVEYFDWEAIDFDAVREIFRHAVRKGDAALRA
jgi:hypothetical protein